MCTFDDDCDCLVDLAVSGTDAEWFAETGNCGRCGGPVEPTEGVSWARLCHCTDCGCGPHPALDFPRPVVPHQQPGLFGEGV